MRWLAAPILIALVLAPAADAKKKQQKKPPLAISALSQHGGKRIGAGERFTITGTIRNRGRSASQALVSATLRRHGTMVFVLGAANVKRIRAHHGRKFTVVATGPALPAGKPARRYVLTACVRARRGGRSVCRHARHSVLVLPASPGEGSGGTPGSGAPGTGTPGSGTPGATFTPGSHSAGDRLFYRWNGAEYLGAAHRGTHGAPGFTMSGDTLDSGTGGSMVRRDPGSVRRRA